MANKTTIVFEQETIDFTDYVEIRLTFNDATHVRHIIEKIPKDAFNDDEEFRKYIIDKIFYNLKREVLKEVKNEKIL